MKRSLCIVAILGAAITVLADLKWQTFRSAEGGFSILMPGKPQARQQNLRASNQNVGVQVFSVAMENEAYTISFAAYDKFDSKDRRTEEALDATVNGIVSNSKGTLTESKGITIGGNPGKAVRFAMPQGLAGRAQVLIAKGRIYQLFVIGPAARVDSTDAAKFFASFRLTP